LRNKFITTVLSSSLEESTVNKQQPQGNNNSHCTRIMVTHILYLLKGSFLKFGN